MEKLQEQERLFVHMGQTMGDEFYQKYVQFNKTHPTIFKRIAQIYNDNQFDVETEDDMYAILKKSGAYKKMMALKESRVDSMIASVLDGADPNEIIEQDTHRSVVGKRVVCYDMKGEKGVPNGTKGTIMHVDDIGQIHVKWDNGSTLALQPEHDRYKILK